VIAAANRQGVLNSYHRFIHAWQLQLPKDYRYLLAETDGFTFEGWRYLGTHARFVVLPQYNVLVLAEVTTLGVLCTVEEDAEKDVCFYEYGNDRLTRLSKHFVEALIECARGTSKGSC
jgi:hypothetical protein